MQAAANSNQEPWLLLNSKQTNYVGTVRIARDAEGKPVYDPETGVPVKERIPTHVPGAAERYETVVRADGHVISMVMTNAAAQVEETNFRKYQKRKQRYFGWFPITQCPVNLLNSGDLNPYQIREKSLLDAQPCRGGKHTEQNPCPHAIAERDARRAQHVVREANNMKAYRAEADKILGQQQELNRELVHDVAVAVASAITGNANATPEPAPVASAPPAPASKKSGGKATTE